MARGEFVQTYEGEENTTIPHTVGAITLGTCGNIQGGASCHSLASGRALQWVWNVVKVLKIPENP